MCFGLMCKAHEVTNEPKAHEVTNEVTNEITNEVTNISELANFRFAFQYNKVRLFT